MNGIQESIADIDWEQSTADLQELLADTLLELKLCRCKEVVSERTKSILQKKLQLAKDEILWLLDKKSRDKEEILQLLCLEIASQQFGITSLQLECHQWEHRALLLERKAECARVEANTLQGACTIIKEENAARTLSGLSVSHRAEEQEAQLRNLNKKMQVLKQNEAQLQGQLLVANTELLEQTKDLQESRRVAEMQQLRKIIDEERADSEIQRLAKQSEDLQRKASTAEKDAAEARSQIVALETQIKERESVLERRLQVLEEDRALAEQVTKERLQNAHDHHHNLEKDLQHQMQTVHARLQHERDSWTRAEKELLDTKSELQRKLAAAMEDLGSLQYQLELKERRITQLQEATQHASALQSPDNLNVALKTVSSLVDDLVPMSVLPKSGQPSARVDLSMAAQPSITPAHARTQRIPLLPLPTALHQAQNANSPSPVPQHLVKHGTQAAVIRGASGHQSTEKSSQDVAPNKGRARRKIQAFGTDASKQGNERGQNAPASEQLTRIENPELKSKRAPTGDGPPALHTAYVPTTRVMNPAMADSLQHSVPGPVLEAGQQQDRQMLDASLGVKKSTAPLQAGFKSDAAQQPVSHLAVSTVAHASEPEGACASNQASQLAGIKDSSGLPISSGGVSHAQTVELKRKTDNVDPPQAKKRAKVSGSKQVNKKGKKGANNQDGDIRPAAPKCASGGKEGATSKTRRSAVATKPPLIDALISPPEDDSEAVPKAKAPPQHDVSPTDSPSASPVQQPAGQRRPVRQRKSGVPYWMGTASVENSAPKANRAKASRAQQSIGANPPESNAASDAGLAKSPVQANDNVQTHDDVQEKGAIGVPEVLSGPLRWVKASEDLARTSGDGAYAEDLAPVPQPKAAKRHGNVLRKSRGRKLGEAEEGSGTVPAQAPGLQEEVGRRARPPRNMPVKPQVSNAEAVEADPDNAGGHPQAPGTGALTPPSGEGSWECPVAHQGSPRKLTRLTKRLQGEGDPSGKRNMPGGMSDSQSGNAISSGGERSKKSGRRKTANSSAEDAGLNLSDGPLQAPSHAPRSPAVEFAHHVAEPSVVSVPDGEPNAARGPGTAPQRGRGQKSEKAVPEAGMLVPQNNARLRAGSARRRGQEGQVPANVQLTSVADVQADAHAAMDDHEAAVPVLSTSPIAEGNEAGPVAHPGPGGRRARAAKRRLKEDGATEAGAAGGATGSDRLKEDAAGNGAGPLLKKSRRQQPATSIVEVTTVPLNLAVTGAPLSVRASDPQAATAGDGGGLVGEPSQKAASVPAHTSPGVHAHPQQQAGLQSAVPAVVGVDDARSNVARVAGTAARPRLGGKISAVVPGLKAAVSQHQKPANPQRKVSRIDLNTLWGEDEEADASKASAAVPAGGYDVQHKEPLRVTNNAILPPDTHPHPAINDRVLEAAAIRGGAPTTAFLNRTLQQLRNRSSLDKGPKRKLLPTQNVVDVVPMGMLLGTAKNSFIVPRLLNKRTL